MGTASFVQNSFLGGEWSPQMQGRFDRPDYRTGLNLCTNIIPIEEGAAPRRSGTRLGGVTRSGAYGVVRTYNVDQRQPYNIELTDGFLRLWQAGASLITHPGTAVSGISSADPAEFTSTAHGLTTGDQVLFTLTSATSYAGISQVLGRQLSVTVTGASTFTAVDALTGATIDGSLIDFGALAGLTVFRIFEIETDYAEADLQQIRVVQDGINATLLHHNYPPQTFVLEEDSNGVFVDATLTDADFYDGPYLDIPTDGSTLTPSATTLTTTFTASSIASINGGQGFVASDVGRLFRIFSEPEEWDSGTSYPQPGLHVKDAGVYWRSVSENGQTQTGDDGSASPSTDSGVNWVIDPAGAAWTWGRITAVLGPDSFTGTLHAAVDYPDNIAGGPPLYTTPCKAWQLGAYCEEEGYPANGAYHQGRIWLGGAIKNRFDASVSNDFGVNDYVNFAPTGKDGTVADNNGIAGTLNASEIENFLWMLPDEQGILAGTQGGEWVIASSAITEPITPTSIQTREATRYGSLNQQAIKVGRATIFAHRDTRKVYEYMANYFTQKFVADNLSLKAKHLTKGKVAEIAYMRELTPVIWVRLEDGGLIGCTYKHDDPIQPLEFAAWHRHELGTGRNVISIQGGPANGGETDTLSMVTQDPTTGYAYVEFLQTIWDDGDSLLTAWYLDGGIAVAAAELIDADTIRLYGLWYMAGQEITVWGAGLDLGDYTVTAEGTIDLTLNAAQSLFTTQRLADITALGCTSLSVDITVPTGDDDAADLVYIMEAKENYDAERVATIAGLTTYTDNSILTDQNYQGIQWDPVRRNLMYMYTEALTTTPTTNTTGFTLWDGDTAIAPNDPVDPAQEFNSFVGVKNIDSEVVTFYSNYDVDNLVPNGIGGGDGTWRRYTQDFQAVTWQDHNGPGMTDPNTGNFWINSQSCPLYCFRLEDNYALSISPLFPVHDPNNLVQVVGFSDSGATGPWTYAREVDRTGSNTAYLYLVPREYTAAEIAADYLLAYATYAYPTWVTNEDYFRGYNREVFDHAGNMYLFSCSPTGAKDFKLYKFEPPVAANYPSPPVGGGFSDITPWGGGTGPNADASGYTLQRPNNGVSDNPETSDILPMYLPATDDLVLVEKFFPSEHTLNSYDPALMKWSCTYVHDPAGSPSFDHHSAFVTGYMTAAWVPTDINGAAYAVMDAFEVNNYLGQSDYDYGMDYTRRWFFFACTKMTAGVSDGMPRIVLVEYEFVYGSAPTVVQVIDEQGWDDRYPDYAPKTTNVYPVGDAPYAPTDTNAVAVSLATVYNSDEFQPLWDVGIHDPVTNSFWWSGGGSELSIATAMFGTFDPQFADRMQQFDGTPGGTNFAATPPFMKLSFGLSYCAPFIVGHTYCSRAQILRPATAQEGMAQTGPVLGKYRRTTDAMPLLADTQGMTMGVDFLDMRPLQFKTNNGIGQAGGGVTALPLTETFSGVYKGQVDADSNFDNMWCWEVCRPYPCTVVAVEIQHKTNENS